MFIREPSLLVYYRSINLFLRMSKLDIPDPETGITPREREKNWMSKPLKDCIMWINRMEGGSDGDAFNHPWFMTFRQILDYIVALQKNDAVRRPQLMIGDNKYHNATNAPETEEDGQPRFPTFTEVLEGEPSPLARIERSLIWNTNPVTVDARENVVLDGNITVNPRPQYQ